MKRRNGKESKRIAPKTEPAVPPPIPGFDCVEFKREVQRRIYEDIKDMSTAEQIVYFRRKADEGPLGHWWRMVKEQAARGTL